MQLQWRRCLTYDQAKDFSKVVSTSMNGMKSHSTGVYVTAPSSAGIAAQLMEIGMNPRYGLSYRHWIEGCLRHNGSLYI